MEWKQLKMTASEQQKAQHLQAVEESLAVRSSRRSFNWAMPMTVLLTAVVLCFLVLLPGEDFGHSDPEQNATAITGSYEKGYVYQDGELGKMPSSVLTYGVNKLSPGQLEKLERWLKTGTPVEAVGKSYEPLYELGLMSEESAHYVQVYSMSFYDGWYVHFVEENRWLELPYISLYDLLNEPVKHRWLSTILLVSFTAFILGYMLYVDKKYMKNEEGRKRKQFANLLHGVIAISCWGLGFAYILFAKGAFIPLGYLLSIGGLVVVMYLDRKNPDYCYRKHYYRAQILFGLYFISLFSFGNSF